MCEKRSGDVQVIPGTVRPVEGFAQLSTRERSSAAVRFSDAPLVPASYRRPSVTSPLVGRGRPLSQAGKRAVTPRVFPHAASSAPGTGKATPLVAGATADGQEDSLLPQSVTSR